MTLLRLEGAPVAQVIKDEVRRDVQECGQGGIRPGLGVLLVGEDPASAVYVRSKTRACVELGIHHELRHLPATATTEEVLGVVESYNRRADIHGILVQLPLPPQVDAQRVLDLILPSKDVDGFHPDNVGRLVQKRPRFVPCTPSGIMAMLRHYGIDPRGSRAVVVGRSDIVGKPMALLLLHADATVTVCHSRTKDLAAVAREADILVAAIGSPGLIGRDHVKPGAVVIDVGMNRITDREKALALLGPARLGAFEEKGQALVGDVDFEAVRDVARAITPVPGGVGPLTIALLMKNTVKAASARA